jgi:hypothetical protein
MKILKKKMMTMHYNFLTIILILSFSYGISSGQSVSDKKIYRKSLPVNKEITLELNNKYGNIHINPWNKDTVSVKVEIEASAPDRDRLHKMLRDVDVDITGTTFIVKVETEFTESITTLFESFKEMTRKIIPYESRIEINYFIEAPEYLDMKIVNRYGDVYMENNTGKLSLNLSNGSFKANSISETGEIKLVFCDATVNNLAKGNINASFSEVEINESHDLTITSISSKFDLKRTAMINVDSKRDKFYIGTINSIKGDSYFTDYHIDELLHEISLNTKYGNLSTALVDKNFYGVTIKSAYTDIDLTFHNLASYNLEIKHLNAFLVLPERKSSIKKRAIDEEKNEFMTSGTVGSNPGNVKVMIDATRGNIHIK